MAWSEHQIRHFWRTKYPWFFVIYIIALGVLRGITAYANPRLSADLLMLGAFTSYIFLYVFYLYGVKPHELEPR